MMKTWIYTEWILFSRRRLFPAFTLGYILLFFLSNRQLSQALDPVLTEAPGLLNPYLFPQVWNTIGYWGHWFIYFPCLMVVANLSQEFQHRTYRQHLIHGWRIRDSLGAKGLLILGLSLLSTLLYLVTGLITGHRNPDWDMGAQFRGVSSFFVLALNYLSLAALLSLWIRRSLWTLALLLVYDIFVENTVRFFFLPPSWKALLPLGSAKSLFSSPWNAQFAALDTGITIPDQYGVPLLMSLAWTFLYAVLGYLLLQRRDA